MRVAIVHDWLITMRGGERVLEGLLDMFPEAEIFTLLHSPGSVSARIEARPIHVSLTGRLPFAERYFRLGLPFMPAMVERFDLRGFDLVISSSHCVAKGVRQPAGVPHLCYCHTPMRYIWDQYDAYFGPGRATLPVRAAMRLLAPRLRAWDRATARRVTGFVANSSYVRDRIRRYWDRDADVVHPPVDVETFRPAARREDFYVCLGALVPYKRVDIVVDAFSRMHRRLVVVGDGQERARLESRAGPRVEFAGRVSDERVRELLGRARGLVHAGVEDFGITLVEAQAAGAPVIAYAAGGALEAVVAGPCDGNGRRPTGVLFAPQTAGALVNAMVELESRSFEPEALAANARRFSTERFHDGMRRAVAAVLDGRR